MPLIGDKSELNTIQYRFVVWCNVYPLYRFHCTPILSNFVHLSAILINQSKGFPLNDNGESLRQFIIKFEFKTENLILNFWLRQEMY